MTTIHTRQLQQYTLTNKNYTQDNLKLATIHTRQIRVHVQNNLNTVLGHCHVHVIWEPSLPGTLRAPRACNGTDLAFLSLSLSLPPSLSPPPGWYLVRFSHLPDLWYTSWRSQEASSSVSCCLHFRATIILFSMSSFNNLGLVPD